MMISKSKMVNLIYILIAILEVGCAAPTKTPDFQIHNFNLTANDTIYVMPALDFRDNKELMIELDKYINEGAKWALGKKHYNCTWLHDKSLVNSISEDNISELNPIILSKLNPPEARWVLFFALEELKVKSSPLGKGAEAEMSGYLYDKSTNKLIWKNNSSKGTGVRVIGVAAIVPLMFSDEKWASDAILFATAEIVKGLPYIK